MKILLSPDDAGGGTLTAAPATTGPSLAPAPATTGPSPAPAPTIRDIARPRESVRPPDAIRPKTDGLKFAAPDKPVTPIKKPVAKVPDAPARGPGRPRLPRTIEIDGKKYTEDEVRELAKAKETTAAPDPEPVTPPTPQVAPQVAPVVPADEQTPEQKKAAHDDLRQQYVDKQIASSDLPEMTSEDLDVIFAGGEDAAKKFNEIRKRDAAYVKRSVVEDMQNLLNPVFAKFEEAVVPLIQQKQAIDEWQVRSQFSTAHPELSAAFPQEAEQLAYQMLEKFPKECAKMTRDEFITELARQTERIANERARGFGYAGWKEVPRKAAPKLAKAPSVSAPVQPVVATPPAPVAPVLPPVRPPVGFGPSGGSLGGAGAPGFQATASSALRPGGVFR